MRVLARSGQQAQGVDGGLWGAQPGVSRIAGGREGESGEGVGRRVAENRGETLRPPTDRLDETGRPEPTPSRVIEALEIPPSPPPPPLRPRTFLELTRRPPAPPYLSIPSGLCWPLLQDLRYSRRARPACRPLPGNLHAHLGGSEDAGRPEHRAEAHELAVPVLHAPRVHHGLPAVRADRRNHRFRHWTAPGKPTILAVSAHVQRER